MGLIEAAIQIVAESIGYAIGDRHAQKRKLGRTIAITLILGVAIAVVAVVSFLLLDRNR